jgi:predicted PurR-regulated permease PerM
VTSASAVFAILASAVIVLGGLVALVRAIWRIAQTLRDNTKATQTLTGKLDSLATSIDGRFDALVERVTRLEGRNSGPLP